MRGDKIDAGLFFPLKEFVDTGLGHGHGKNRTHCGAHCFQRKRIGAITNQDNAGGACGICRTDNRAEIAGIADPVQCNKGLGFSWLDIAQRTPPLIENTDNHLRIVATRDR
ncbi:hypothetical protein D3C80_1711160 [compost metagenome]